MAYLPFYKNDIFISYAHIDNQTVYEDEEGWISQFQKYLEVRLSQLIGRMDIIKIWRDTRSLDGSQLFDKTIQEAIDGSAILLTMTSHGYINSEYCKKELRRFLNKASKEDIGLTVGNHMRIINVLLYNIPHEKWPREYGKTTGFQFYNPEQNGLTGIPSDPREKDFQEQFQELLDAIYITLEQFKVRIENKLVKPLEKKAQTNEVDIQNENLRDDTPETQSNLFTVYFADVADSIRLQRKHLITQLREKRNLIKSDIPPPFDARQHEKKVIEVLGKSNVSVHMFDHLAGREVDGESGNSYPQKQFELAMTHSKSKIIWIPDDLYETEIPDIKHKKFLFELEKTIHAKTDCYLIRGSSKNTFSDILKEVDKLRLNRDFADIQRTVLLDFHFTDYKYALEVNRFLKEKGIPIHTGPDSDDPKSNMKLYEERLRRAGVLILFYGHVDESWVSERLKVVLQLIIAKNYPTKAIGIYLPIPKRKSLRFGSKYSDIELCLIDNSKSEKVSVKVFKSFFRRIGLGELI